MGRFDLLTQLDTKTEKPPASPVSPSSQIPVQEDAPVSKHSPTSVQKERSATPKVLQRHDTTTPRYHDTMTSRHHDTNNDTMIPSSRDTTIPQSGDDMLEEVRRAVRQIGKEPATQRLTLEEKQILKSIEFTYGQQGITTSGNEIIRIATNYIIREYQKQGENSILAKVLKRLNS
jgi:hypothetical protein